MRRIGVRTQGIRVGIWVIGGGNAQNRGGNTGNEGWNAGNRGRECREGQKLKEKNVFMKIYF